MVGSGNGASKWAEMLFGHVWGGPVVGTTSSISTCNKQLHISEDSQREGGLLLSSLVRHAVLPHKACHVCHVRIKPRPLTVCLAR